MGCGRSSSILPCSNHSIYCVGVNDGIIFVLDESLESFLQHWISIPISKIIVILAKADPTLFFNSLPAILNKNPNILSIQIGI